MESSFSEITAQLRDKLAEIDDIQAAAAVLGWDMTTYMPPGGSAARGRQLATLARLAHERATDPALGKTLDAAESRFEAEIGTTIAAAADNDDAALLRLVRREYERRIRIPSKFAAEAADHSTRSYGVWATARGENDFAAVQPYLEKTLDLSRRYADFFDTYVHPADVFIDDSDFGLSVELIRPLFAELGAGLKPLVQRIAAQPKPRHEFLHRHYPEAQQIAFGDKIARRLGYDFTRGRQDKTHHPFMTKFSHGDVRITTRVNEQDIGDNTFSVMHEVGHALYEQGVAEKYESTPLNGGTSNGVHESQSRLWENLVGRSRGFWQHSFGDLQAAFPDQLRDVSAEEFYRAINLVEPSLIRTDADEVTYNLHVIIRFELECRLLEGDLAIEDLPAAWHDAYEDALGVRAPSDVDGVLQDVHWYAGFIGGSFQGYALGNIISCQVYETALEENPNITTHVQRGELMPLLHWLQNNIYRHGSKYTTQQLLERVTGSGITLAPYFRYLHEKFGDLYELDNLTGT
ncbi:MAG: carboxypeptidase M32 [Litorilinea sp.]